MSSKKTPLQEVAASADAFKNARSEPIQQEHPRQSMDFLRSLVLDVPMQQARPVAESMNIERMLETQLEFQARKMESHHDEKDHIAFDVPLLIRVFELVREGIHSDVELHQLVERLIAMREKGVLTMDDYEAIAGGNPNGEVEEKPKAKSEIELPKTNTNLDQLKKLAGLR